MAKDYSHLDKILRENEGWDGITGTRKGSGNGKMNHTQEDILAYLVAGGMVPASCATGNYIPEDVYAAIMGES